MRGSNHSLHRSPARVLNNFVSPTSDGQLVTIISTAAFIALAQPRSCKLHRIQLRQRHGELLMMMTFNTHWREEEDCLACHSRTANGRGTGSRKLREQRPRPLFPGGPNFGQGNEARVTGETLFRPTDVHSTSLKPMTAALYLTLLRLLGMILHLTHACCSAPD